MYRVVRDFYDLQDNGHAYLSGDIFPRKGLEVSRERLDYLAGSGNRLGEPVIAEQKSKKKDQ